MKYSIGMGIKRAKTKALILFTALALVGGGGLSLAMFGTANAIQDSVTPSTNDINRTNGWAHVDQLSEGVGTTDLQFISTRAFWSCFEYRTDGDTSQILSEHGGVNYNTLVTDGLYPYVCENNSNETLTIPANSYVEVRMVFGAETDERFDWTRFDVLPATATVTITKYVDGVQATAANTNSTSFPMVATWSAANIGSGSGAYNLGPVGFNNSTPYTATTSALNLGATYTTNEVTGSIVGSACTPNGTPYALVGYTTGDSLASAAAATPTLTIPNFTDLQQDEYVIVWNVTCKTPTTKTACMNGGWQDFNAPEFRNQGLCVAWVNHNDGLGQDDHHAH